MRKEYDFSRSQRNPYLRKLKKQITIRLDAPTLEYFKDLSEETGIGYQTLINSYLSDCARRGLKPELQWGQQEEQTGS